jgi:fatty-acid desaturase
MKTALKRKNDEFLVMPLKHVLSVMGLVNHPGTPILWAIAHENHHKCKNDEFLVISLKHVLSFMSLVNHPGTPKLWAIAHEDDPKTQKR